MSVENRMGEVSVEQQAERREVAGRIVTPQGPLSLPPVIAIILKYVETPGVVSCRLINRDWNKACNIVLNLRKEIEIRSCVDAKRYCDVFSTAIDGVSLKLTSIHFDGPFFDEISERVTDGQGGIVALTSVLYKLSKVAGPQIKKLRIGYIRIDHDWTVAVSAEVYSILCLLVFELFTNVTDMELENYLQVTPGLVLSETTNLVEVSGIDLPNLKNLTLERTGVYGAENNFLTKFNNLVVQSAINLTTLTLDVVGIEDILSSNTAISSKLESLVINSNYLELSDAQMDALTAHTFPNLKSLSAYVALSGNNYREVHQFLVAYAEVITYLILDVKFEYSSREEEVSDFQGLRPGQSHEYIFPPRNVVMPKLRELLMGDFGGRIFLKFLWENMPSLTDLEFQPFTIYPEILQSSPDLSNWTLRNLEFTFEKYKLQDIYSTLQSPVIPVWFSCLSRLTLKSDSAVLKDIIVMPEIFRRCGQLKALQVCSESYTEETNKNFDQVITGFSDNARRNLRQVFPHPTLANQRLSGQSYKDKLLRGIQVSREAQRKRTIPYIGSLSELLELHLSLPISDDAVLFGIVMCTKLRKLYLKSTTRGLTKLSKRVVRCGLEDLADVDMKM